MPVVRHKRKKIVHQIRLQLRDHSVLLAYFTFVSKLKILKCECFYIIYLSNSAIKSTIVVGAMENVAHGNNDLHGIVQSHHTRKVRRQ